MRPRTDIINNIKRAVLENCPFFVRSVGRSVLEIPQPAEPPGEGGAAPCHGIVVDHGVDRAGIADQHHAALCARDCRVEQVSR